MGVRRAVESDLEAIHPLLEQRTGAGLNRRRMMWREALGLPGYAAWIAEVDGRPVGFIDLFVFPDVSPGRKIGLINNLIVDARVRGRGLGRGLLREAIAQCRKERAVELHVWTAQDNTPAIALYKRLGFVDRALLLELQVQSRRIVRR